MKWNNEQLVVATLLLNNIERLDYRTESIKIYLDYNRSKVIFYTKRKNIVNYIL